MESLVINSKDENNPTQLPSKEYKEYDSKYSKEDYKENKDKNEIDFNLSNKIEEADEDTIEEYGLIPYEQEWLYVEDVKEFIKLLKEELSDVKKRYFGANDIINKLAGDRLK